VIEARRAVQLAPGSVDGVDLAILAPSGYSQEAVTQIEMAMTTGGVGKPLSHRSSATQGYDLFDRHAPAANPPTPE
jgi:hypothetical protein